MSFGVKASEGLLVGSVLEQVVHHSHRAKRMQHQQVVDLSDLCFSLAWQDIC